MFLKNSQRRDSLKAKVEVAAAEVESLQKLKNIFEQQIFPPQTHKNYIPLASKKNIGKELTI